MLRSFFTVVMRGLDPHIHRKSVFVPSIDCRAFAAPKGYLS